MMMRTPILCADGTIISVQASSTHYCSPKSDAAFSYSAVEIMIEYPNNPEHYNCVEKTEYYCSAEKLMKLINEHGGIVGGELPPLNFGHHTIIKQTLLQIAIEGDAWWQQQQVEKQAEESQRRREYGYVHPTVDDYDESLDDPNYEEPEGDEDE